MYFLSTDTVLYAASTISGQTELGDPDRQRFETHAPRSSPITRSTWLRATLLYALQSKSSRVKWSVPMPGEITTTPAVARGIIYFAFKDGKTARSARSPMPAS